MSEYGEPVDFALLRSRLFGEYPERVRPHEHRMGPQTHAPVYPGDERVFRRCTRYPCWHVEFLVDGEWVEPVPCTR